MRVITLDTNKKVISVKTVGEAYVLQPNDIETELGDMGQIQQLDGSFIVDTTPPPPQPPAIEDRIQIIEDTLMEPPAIEGRVRMVEDVLMDLLI